MRVLRHCCGDPSCVPSLRGQCMHGLSRCALSAPHWWTIASLLGALNTLNQHRHSAHPQRAHSPDPQSSLRSNDGPACRDLRAYGLDSPSDLQSGVQSHWATRLQPRQQQRVRAGGRPRPLACQCSANRIGGAQTRLMLSSPTDCTCSTTERAACGARLGNGSYRSVGDRSAGGAE